MARSRKSIPTEHLFDLYETMALIRAVELKLAKLFADGEIPGFIHLSVGQEAVAAGVMYALQAQDTIATTHRGHGHVIAKGIDLDRFFMEVMGRDGGSCGGRGGSMHVADMAAGILGANGIVGAGIPIALGSALAHQVRGNGRIATAFFGDGAQAEGTLHEALNLSSLWGLPMLFACEKNGWSEFSPTARQFAADLQALAAAFGVPFSRTDGNDVEAVAMAAQAAASGIRRDGRPHVLECLTRRVRGHYEGDAQKYRTPEDLAGNDRDDPIRRAAEALKDRGTDEPALREAEQRAGKRVDIAVERARDAALPDFRKAQGDVYTGE